MKILVITQAVDKQSQTLGFFHDWIRELAGHFEFVTVVCLEKGNYDLPYNVRVFSLGKERVKFKTPKVFTRIKYGLKFLRLIFKLRREYESVFAHMNQEYVLLGGWLFKLLRRKVYLWRNHPDGSWLTRLAVAMASLVFYTSPASFTAKFKKARQMPVGVDTDRFTIPDGKLERRVQDSVKILSLGRIAPVKNIELILEAAKILKAWGWRFELKIVGSSGKDEKSRAYESRLKDFVGRENLTREVIFQAGVTGDETPKNMSENDIFINTTKQGSLDKTIFEAMAAGTVAITSNQTLLDWFGGEDGRLLLFKEGDPEDLAKKIVMVAGKLKAEGRELFLKELRKKTVETQSLKRLGERLESELKN